MSHPEIRLFLDIRNSAELGKQSVFNWWVANIGPQPIAKLELRLEQSSPNDAISLEPCRRDRLGAQNDGAIKCPTSYVVHRAGSQSLGVRIHVTYQSGKELELVAQQEAMFDFDKLNATGPAIITIDGAALVRSPPARGTVVNIKGDALLDWGSARDTASASSPLNVQMDHSMPELEHLREVLLCEPRPNGLGPVDFRLFAEHWQKSRRHPAAHLSFVVDNLDKGGPFAEPLDERAPDRSDLYRLRVGSYTGGHVTLLARGTSGHFRIWVPNTHGGIDKIRPNQTLRLPGELLPGGIEWHGQRFEINFVHHGEEQVLVLITAQPLMDPRVIIHGEIDAPEKPQFSFCAPEVVISLLEGALARPETELGFASVIVQPG